MNLASWLPLAADCEFTQPRDHLLADRSRESDRTVCLFKIARGLDPSLSLSRAEEEENELKIDRVAAETTTYDGDPR